MGKSQRLRLTEVRAAFRLVGECRELGREPLGWRGHLAGGIRALLGGGAGVCGEGSLAAGATALAYDGLAAERMDQFFRGEGTRSSVVTRFPRGRGGVIVRRRECVVSDSEWYDSPEFNEVLRPCGLDAGILSVCGLPDGTDDVLMVHPELGQRHDRRHARLVALVHGEIVPLIGSRLARGAAPAGHELTPRLRQVLACLLDGSSEKQVAVRLGIHPTTVHDHVKRLYRHFRVNSRAELMAFFVGSHGC